MRAGGNVRRRTRGLQGRHGCFGYLPSASLAQHLAHEHVQAVGKMFKRCTVGVFACDYADLELVRAIPTEKHND